MGRRNLTDDQRAIIWNDIYQQRAAVSRANVLSCWKKVSARIRSSSTRMGLKINPELQAVVAPLTTEECAQLRDNIQKDGLLEPITLWAEESGTILDGHNRYAICHCELPSASMPRYLQLQSLFKPSFRTAAANSTAIDAALGGSATGSNGSRISVS